MLLLWQIRRLEVGSRPHGSTSVRGSLDLAFGLESEPISCFGDASGVLGFRHAMAASTTGESSLEAAIGLLVGLELEPISCSADVSGAIRFHHILEAKPSCDATALGDLGLAFGLELEPVLGSGSATGIISFRHVLAATLAGNGSVEAAAWLLFSLATQIVGHAEVAEDLGLDYWLLAQLGGDSQMRVEASAGRRDVAALVAGSATAWATLDRTRWLSTLMHGWAAVALSDVSRDRGLEVGLHGWTDLVGDHRVRRQLAPGVIAASSEAVASVLLDLGLFGRVFTFSLLQSSRLLLGVPRPVLVRLFAESVSLEVSATEAL